MNVFSDYDFTGKRVCYQGKSLSKFDLACHIDNLKPCSCITLIYDIFSYDALRCKLFYWLTKRV